MSQNIFISLCCLSQWFYPRNWKLQHRIPSIPVSCHCSPVSHQVQPEASDCREVWDTQDALAYSHMARRAETLALTVCANGSIFMPRFLPIITREWQKLFQGSAVQTEGNNEQHTTSSLSMKEVSSKSSALAFLLTHSIHTLWSEVIKQLVHWEAWEVAAQLMSLGQHKLYSCSEGSSFFCSQTPAAAFILVFRKVNSDRTPV